MPANLTSPDDSLERQNEKLRAISAALMRRVEQDTQRAGAAYVHFERTALLEDQVRQRTRDLEHALDLLNQSNAALAEARSAAELAHANMSNAIEAVEEGFALFDAQDRLVMHNTRFCQLMPDVKAHLSRGLSFADYVATVSQSRFLDHEDAGDAATWAQHRLDLHADAHVMFNVRLRSDHWMQVSEYRTPDGGTVILQTDVTDIMRIERQERGKLLDSQARMLRATLDHLNQGVCIFDGEATLVGWNTRIRTLLNLPAALVRLGMGFDRLMDHVGGQLDASADRIQAMRRWAHQTEPRKPLQFEVRRGPALTLHVFAQEMPDRGFVISFTDVSAERAAAQALKEANAHLEQRVRARTLELEDALASAERANASKTRFVAAASHDLLQPLSAAKLYMASLVDTPSGPTADKALNALGSVEGIIDALLDISKLDSGAVSLDVVSVSLVRLLSELRNEFEPIAAQKGLDLRILPSRAVVRSDPGFLRRILQNLISNAIRYTQKGRVLVGVRQRGAFARVDVLDTGPGIPDVDQERIFKEFERLAPRVQANEGLGLGLAIVERACAQLGHPLGLSSALGQGTRFSVSLERVLSDGPLTVPEDDVPAPLPAGIAGLVVLLVENEPDLRAALAGLIESWGAHVLEADSAPDALRLIDEIEILPDVAVLDHQLGDGPSGLDLAVTLQRLSGGIRSCIVSADRSAALKSACAQTGFPLFAKPVEADSLRAFLCETRRAAVSVAARDIGA